jgi:hypothetical protein
LQNIYKRAIYKRIYTSTKIYKSTKKGAVVDRRKRKRNKRQNNHGYGKKRAFRVFPSDTLNWNKPSRSAIVDWGKGEIKEYKLDYLSNYELRHFWRMENSDKADYLCKYFNRHHRKPRCQKGLTENSNLSYVDIESHIGYNRLISVVARWSNLSIEMVQTEHLAKFLRKVYPSLERRMTNPVTFKLRSLENLLERKNLDDISPFFIANVAKWTGLEFESVLLSDVRHFLEYIYHPIKRLAYDHDLGRLKSLVGFIKTLNKIWLPIDDQIFFRF